MLVSIDRLRQGRVKKLIGMTHKFSLGESILQRIAHEIRHRFDDVRQQPHRVGLSKRAIFSSVENVRGQVSTLVMKSYSLLERIED